MNGEILFRWYGMGVLVCVPFSGGIAVASPASAALTYPKYEGISDDFLEVSPREPLSRSLEVRWDLVPLPVFNAGTHRRFTTDGNALYEHDEYHTDSIVLDDLYTVFGSGDFRFVLTVLDRATPDGESAPRVLPGYVFDGVSFGDAMITTVDYGPVSLVSP